MFFILSYSLSVFFFPSNHVLIAHSTPGIGFQTWRHESCLSINEHMNNSRREHDSSWFAKHFHIRIIWHQWNLFILQWRKQPKEVIVILSRSFQAHSRDLCDIKLLGSKYGSVSPTIFLFLDSYGEQMGRYVVSDIDIEYCFCGSACLYRGCLFNSVVQVNLSFHMTKSGLTGAYRGV